MMKMMMMKKVFCVPDLLADEKVLTGLGHDPRLSAASSSKEEERIYSRTGQV